MNTKNFPKAGRAFIEPTVVNGKVYVACEDHIGVFFCANEHKIV
jgi:hypothetical protein